ncbi:MAG: SusD/RagB family nutrient-binding outer membrane lipoprotein [Cytophagaceae bacterium]|jgi:hypothetical protein|nr:SusD/RagB family nutrient-binding outer membrane lipoprotein [Cytophagaceae bacterium]
MKNRFCIAALTVMLFSFTGCKDSLFDELYIDPSKTTEVSCEKLMTGVFYQSLRVTKPSYYHYYTMNIMTLARYTQTVGVANSEGMFHPNDGYNTGRWQVFYKSLTNFRLLEDTYSKLDAAGRSDNEIFLLAAKVFLYGQLQEIVDLWGDVPFSEAGMLPITGDVVSSYAKYDSAEELYRLMLTELKAINTRLSELDGKLSSVATTYFIGQDYINKGDIMKWRRYANSLRLRMAMHVASQGALADEGKAALKEMLDNATTYPLVESNDQNIQITADAFGFNPLKDEDGSNGIMQAFEGLTNDPLGATNRAPKSMLDRMVDDPRLPVMFSPNTNGEYKGLVPEDRPEDQSPGLEAAPNIYASIDSATISRNDNMPGILFTAAEVSFIKAEACNEGYAGSIAQAQTEFEKAVTQSINFYFDLNSVSTYATPLERPDAATIATFATSKWTGDGKEAIATQKWLHLGLIHTEEAWNGLRRTKLPALTYMTDNSSTSCKTPVDRFVYPIDESDFNSANYETVKAKDTYYTKLFWAK